MLGSELIQDTRDKVRVIKERMSAAQSQQKSYVDNRTRPLEFEVGDCVSKDITDEGSDAIWKEGKA
jgi:hypothetical protein